MRTISSSEAKANLGDVLSSLGTHGPVDITRNGKPVGRLTLPTAPPLDSGRMASLALAYSKGLISWPQIADETGSSYGDLLIAVGLQNLRLPKVSAKNRPEQKAYLCQILDAAATAKSRSQ